MKKRRRYTVEEKLEILEEARAPGATVAEVLRRHGVGGTTFYRWERRAKEGMREALNGRRKPEERGEAAGAGGTERGLARGPDVPADSGYLVLPGDGAGRLQPYVVHWKLLTSMRAADVRPVVQEALELTGATPEIVSDNGVQFTGREFKQMVRLFELEHIRIRTYHPESNGRLERFPRTTRGARARRGPRHRVPKSEGHEASME